MTGTDMTARIILRTAATSPPEAATEGAVK